MPGTFWPFMFTGILWIKMPACGFRGDGFAMFDGAELIKDYVSEDYLVMSTYAMTFDGADAAGLPHLSSANSPLAAYPGYLLNYEQPYGAGRITIL